MTYREDITVPERLHSFEGRVLVMAAGSPTPEGDPRTYFNVATDDGSTLYFVVTGLDVDSFQHAVGRGDRIAISGWPLPGEEEIVLVRNFDLIERAPAEAKGHKKREGWRIVTLGLMTFKFLKIAKAAKLVLLTASLGAYAWMFSWTFAALMVTALSIHEWGHVIAMRRGGIKTRGFYLIPFVGGVAVADTAMRTRRDHLYVAAMGPVFGLASIPLIGAALWALADFPTALGGAGLVAMVNLFNLLPIRPLDGGRMLAAVLLSLSRRLGLLFMGLTVLAATALLHFIGSTVFAIILVIAAADLLAEIRKPADEDPMSLRQCLAGLAVWLALIAAFGGVVAAGNLDPRAGAALAILSGKTHDGQAATSGKSDDGSQ